MFPLFMSCASTSQLSFGVSPVHQRLTCLRWFTNGDTHLKVWWQQINNVFYVHKVALPAGCYQQHSRCVRPSTMLHFLAGGVTETDLCAVKSQLGGKTLQLCSLPDASLLLAAQRWPSPSHGFRQQTIILPFKALQTSSWHNILIYLEKADTLLRINIL